MSAYDNMVTKSSVTKYRVDETNRNIKEYRDLLRGVDDDPNILTTYEENFVRRVRDWASKTHDEFSPAEDAAPDDDEYTTAVTDALRGLGDLIDTADEILNRNEDRIEHEIELKNAKKEEEDKKKREEEKKKEEEEEKKREEEEKEKKGSCCS